MRKLSATAIVALAGCALPPNAFTVEDETGLVRSASLVLCGSITPVRRQGKRFSLSQPVECEGSGYIRLIYVSGEEHQCPIGYVTPRAKQTFNFSAREQSCRPLPPH